VRVRVGNMRLTGFVKARQIDALQRGIGPLQEQLVKEAGSVHGG
jgi:hypothetical protein